MTRGKKIGLTVAIVLVLGTAGFICYKKYKKKKEEESSEDVDPTTPVNDGVVYRGINAEQTRILQEKLNQFILDGKLGMVLGWLGNLGEGWWDKIKSGVSNLIFPSVSALSVAASSITSSNALENMKTTIAPNLTNGSLVVDGKYGKNTKAVVSALQIYLNAVKGSNLTVDGKYGKNTDAATGWHICS